MFCVVERKGGSRTAGSSSRVQLQDPASVSCDLERVAFPVCLTVKMVG